ncbi:MAG: hypothetical protein MRY74_16940 [Neomegalonema sp.]|nr:hypothetical protein [Neomegalonema sp.]
MSNDEPLILLMGNVGSGKSSLIQSWKRCADDGHGLHRDCKISLEEGNPASIDALDELIAIEDPAMIHAATLHEYTQEAVEGDKYSLEATNVMLGVPVNITVVGPDGREETRSVRVVDVPGGWCLPDLSELNRKELDRDYVRGRQTYEALLEHAEGVVFCFDCFKFNAEGWIRTLDDLAAIVARAAGRQGKERRVAIAFTKTERLLLHLGRYAGAAALDWGTMRAQLRRVLDLTGNNALERWRAASDKANGALDVLCFPTSAFGYIGDNGAPNVSPDGKTWQFGVQQPIEEDEDEDDIDGDTPVINVSGNWEPLMTVDPLLFAAFGSQSSDNEDSPTLSYMHFALKDFNRPGERERY